MAETDIEQHRTARHLDDPTPILAGLSLLQLFGIFAATGVAKEVWGVLAFMGGPENAALYQVRILVVALLWLVLAGLAYLQFRGKTEPFAMQLLGYLRRPHRYRGTPVGRARIPARPYEPREDRA